MKETVFTGTCTAMVTPFQNGKIDYSMLEKLIQRQIDSGINSIVFSGTTGESATLSDTEKLCMIRWAKDLLGESCCIIAGTGSNSTDHAVWLSEAAQQMGADALLCVSPYYNKASESGLVAHYTKIADSVNIPVIMYNVPSRTGVDIPVRVYRELSGHKRIAGVKEASTDIAKIARLIAECPKSFSVWSGNDNMAVPTIAIGGKGLISVASNVFPAAVKIMIDSAVSGDIHRAAKLQSRLLPVIDSLFSDVNPIPVKAAMKLIGFDCGECRLPLTRMSDQAFLYMKNCIERLIEESGPENRA